MFTIYTKSNCGYCVQAKQLLEQNGYSYIEASLDNESVLEDFKRNYPYIKTAPAVFKDGAYLGGFKELNENVMRQTSGGLLLEG